MVSSYCCFSLSEISNSGPAVTTRRSRQGLLLNTQLPQPHDGLQVNQRALIDKVLARYSGEFTVFRELLQNSDDAQSKAVEIHFESERYVKSRESGHDHDQDTGLPDLKTALVCCDKFSVHAVMDVQYT